MLTILPTLSQSPIVQGFRWSPLIHAAFDANFYLISTSTQVPLTASISTSSINPYTPIPGLLALHIRRGHYEERCRHLADHSATFFGFSNYPPLIDSFEPPLNPKLKKSQRRTHYMAHCYPTIQQIVEKISKVRRSDVGQDLREIFIMTNAPHEWITELKKAIAKASFWDQITSSRDLDLNWEQKYVAQAVDMLIGQRAQVFIGNGVCHDIHSESHVRLLTSSYWSCSSPASRPT